MHQAISRKETRQLFWAPFVAVLREGIELALFLTAVMIASSSPLTWLGGVIGLVLAVATAWAVFASTLHLDLRRFFQVTGSILLAFAAGLVGRGVHAFVEIGWLPALANPVWNTATVLDDTSILGQIARSLLGYRNTPSLVEVIAYTAYLVVVLALVWHASRAPA